MKIKLIKKVEGCLEGTNVYDLFTSDPITRDFLESFDDETKLKISTPADGVDKAFYRLIFPGKITLKGALGISSMRCILPTENLQENLREFIAKAENRN